MISIVIGIAALACIVLQRAWYKTEMHCLGAAVIGEAYRIRDGWPDHYPDYRRRAVASFNDHGCADLVQYLPAIDEGSTL